MSYVFETQGVPTVPIAGIEEFFPVHRIYCVGQNYAKHAREMGINADRVSPFFFNKPADSIFSGSTQIPFPSATENLQHEVELVVAIGRKGNEIKESEALEYIFGYAVGLDLTRRDLQIEAKNKGLPWRVTFSYARAIQQSALNAWCGKDENLDQAQGILAERAMLCSQASVGKL